MGGFTLQNQLQVSFSPNRGKKEQKLHKTCGGARSQHKLSREVHKCLLCKTLLPWGENTPNKQKHNKKSHSQAFVTVVIQTFLKPLKLIKILGLMPKAGQGCIKKGGKHTPSAWMCCHNTSVGCNLDSHSSSLLPLFLYIKFHSNLIILIAAFLNSKQTAPRNGAFRGTQWAGDIFFFFWH